MVPTDAQLFFVHLDQTIVGAAGVDGPADGRAGQRHSEETHFKYLSKRQMKPVALVGGYREKYLDQSIFHRIPAGGVVVTRVAGPSQIAQSGSSVQIEESVSFILLEVILELLDAVVIVDGQVFQL